MYIFVDESGTNKPHGVCVFTAVLVEPSELMGLNHLVAVAEQRAGVYSFHWKSAPWPVRKSFIAAVSKGDFLIRYQFSKNPLRNFGEALESMLVTASEGMTIDRIILDGRKDKSYERRLKKTLRDKGLSSKRLRTANDESYPVLRVADAVAGLLRAQANKPTGATASMISSLHKQLN